MERDPLNGVNTNILKTLIRTTVERTWDRAIKEAEDYIEKDGMYAEQDEIRLRKLEGVASFFGIDVYKW